MMTRIAAAAAIFAVLAVAFSFPLAWHLDTHLPGGGAGDNVAFLWNFWWMRTALAIGTDIFHSAYLFVPSGTDLSLHTHTALPAFIGATALSSTPVIAAQNLTILVSLFLNGFCAWLLAWRVSGDGAAAIVGGLIFAGSPYVTAHLHGHFNLTAAFVLPLFAIAAAEAARGSARWAVATGLALGATAYIDYYYVVYEVVLGCCLVAFAARRWSIRRAKASRVSRRFAFVLLTLALLDVALIAWILATGGSATPIGPIRSIRGIFNPLQALWLLLALAVWLWVRPSLSARRRCDWSASQAARIGFTVGAVFVAVAAPLLWKMTALIAAGDYVSQQYSWRSAPKGIDAATILLGNPFHPIWGASVTRIYETLGIDRIEGTAWLGVAPVLLAAAAVRLYFGTPPPASGDSASRHRTRTEARRWTAIGVIFFLWALGPHLTAFGHNTAMILPQTLVRFVPIVNNARIPGRAIVVTYLAMALLAAIAVAHRRRAGIRGGGVPIIAAVAVLLDFLPAPFPLTRLDDHRRLYEVLREYPGEGAVCELPLGVRDGFGERGDFDERILFFQTIHERPLVGGFVARLSPSVAEVYRNDPLLAVLLNLSERGGGGNFERALPDRQLAGNRLRQNGIGFVVLNRSTASPALLHYVERVLPLTLIAREGDRALYRVEQQ